MGDLAVAGDDRAKPGVEIGSHAKGNRGFGQDLERWADVRKAAPGVGPSEVVPELGKRALAVWYLLQDSRDDPAPPSGLDRLVGGERATRFVVLVVLKTTVKPRANLRSVDDDPLASGRGEINVSH